MRKDEGVMLTLSDQWGRDRKTLNANTPRDGLGWGSRTGVIRPRRRALRIADFTIG
jgi:hypothetical protein